MKKTGLIVAGLVASATSFGLGTGNLVVMVVGDGGVTTGNQPTALRSFTTAGSVVGSDVSLINLGGRNLTVSYDERSEGGLQLAGNQRFLMSVGYDLTPRDAGFSTFTTDRVVTRTDINGIVTFSAGFQVPSGDGVRQVWSDTGNDYTGCGGDLGLVQGTFTTTIATQILPIFRSSRSVQKYGNTYYFSGSNAFAGINGVASWDGTNQVDLFPTQDGLSGRDLHVVNHRTIYMSAHPTGAGLVKFIKDDTGNWVEAYRAAPGTGAEHLAVYGNTIYATSAQGQQIVKTTDTKTGFTPWQVIATNTVPGTRFRGIDFAPRPLVQGTITLNDITGSANGQVLTLEFWQGSTLVDSIETTLDATGGYSAGINLTGTYRMSAMGVPFLRKDGGNVNLAVGTPIVKNFTLTNGDSDGSGEVDAVDIDLVIAAFGQTSSENPADVDRSLEVDAVDIDIVIANFGNVNDF